MLRITQAFYRTFASSSKSLSNSNRMPNRLINEKSPYLLQHAFNPVDWYPWGKEAFEVAAKQNKLIFLSIGYSTCHWCHVMEKESFDKENVAEVLNKNFINVKVDREMLPDVDRVYMLYVQATTGSGGWPLSLWLTPDFKPVFGGTYFPPEGYYGRPAFTDVCELLASRWERDPEKLKQGAERMVEELKNMNNQEMTDKHDYPDWNAVDRAFQSFKSRFDSLYGGFSKEPKFPTPVTFQFLLTYYRMSREKISDEDLLLRVNEEMESVSIKPEGKNDLFAKAKDIISETNKNADEALYMCEHTLACIAKGGIHDHVGQGIHRYSTDYKWHVPHFEKMLYDQAQLISSYSDLYKITKKPLYKEMVEDIFTYVTRDLCHKDGAFYSAEDADSLPKRDSEEKLEGAFAVWTYNELKHVLGEKSKIFCDFFSVKPEGNIDPSKDIQGELEGQNILMESCHLSDLAKKYEVELPDAQKIISDCKKKLFEVRQMRPKPHLDDKIITAWNGLIISGLCNAYQGLKDRKYLQEALKAAEFIKNNLYDSKEKQLYRSYREGKSNFGSADDYAFLINGILDLHQTSYDDKWLQWAYELQEKMDEVFWDNKSGGYFSSPETATDVLIRMKDDNDGAEPSSNSIALKNLIRFSTILSDKPEYEEKAWQLAVSFSLRLKQIPQSIPQFLQSFMIMERGKEIIISGPKEEAKRIAEELQSHFLPDCVVSVANKDSDHKSLLYQHNPVYRTIADNLKKDDPVAMYMCDRKTKTCSAPVHSIPELMKIL